MNGYWSKLLDKRVSRLRALAASGSAALAGALLAACGGATPAVTGRSRDQSGLLSPAEDTRKQAVGGMDSSPEYRPALQAARAPYLAAGKAPVNSVVGTTALDRVGALIEIGAIAVLA